MNIVNTITTNIMCIVVSATIILFIICIIFNIISHSEVEKKPSFKESRKVIKYDENVDNGYYLNVPSKDFIDQELCDKFIINGGHLNKIPDEFITQNLCDIFIDNNGNLDEVPNEFLTQNICDKYIKRGGDLNKVPHEFLTQDLYNIFFIIQINQKNIDLNFIYEIPDKFITQNMIDEYFVLISKILQQTYLSPNDKYKLKEEYLNELITKKKYILQDINRYLTWGGSLIPYAPYLNEKHYENLKYFVKFINKCSQLNFVNKEYDMWDIYVTYGGDLSEVPDKYINAELCSKAIKNMEYDGMPKKYLTTDFKKMYLENYNKHKNIDKKISDIVEPIKNEVSRRHRTMIQKHNYLYN